MMQNLRAFQWLLLATMTLIFDPSGLCLQKNSSGTRPYVPPPTIVGKIGEKDADALSELKAAAAASWDSSWIELTASGYRSFGTDANARKQKMTITWGRQERFRADAGESDEVDSLRIDGLLVFRKVADGRIFHLPLAAPIGNPFLTSADLWDISQLPSTIVVDEGTVNIGGSVEHKITLVVPAGLSKRQVNPGTQTDEAINLYFDPSTHFLRISARRCKEPNTPSNTYVQTMFYDDYRSVDGVEVPFRMSESDNQQPTLTFTAREVHSSEKHEASFFRF